MTVRLNLHARTMMLVAFPVLCQLLLLCTMGMTLWNMQRDLSRQFRAKTIVSEAYTAAAEITQAAALRATAGTSLDSSLVTSMSMRAIGRMNSLCAILRTSAIHEGQAERLDLAAKQVFDDADACWRTRELGRGWEAETKSIDRLHEIVREIVSSERQNGDHTSSLRAGWQHPVHSALIFAVAANAFLALGLGLWYVATIREPLNRLKQNSRLLAELKPLPEALQGVDELAKVDRVLHNVAREIELALNRERALVEYAADLVCALDENGRFTSANPFCQRMLGFAPQQLIGLSLFDLVAAQDVAVAREHLQAAISSGSMQNVELRLRKSTGELIDTRWSSIWSNLEQELFCVVHDVSEQKRIEDLKQDFVNMVTHDLRSPLTALFGALKLISVGAKGPVSPAVEAEINSAASNVSKLVIFVNDLLDFQKLRVGQMQINPTRCDLQEIFVEAVAFVRGIADSKKVIIELPLGHWYVKGDKPKLLQAITNLLANAIKFTPADSSVIVAVNDLTDKVEVSVSDSGPGVPEQYRERIFEAFEQVPSVASGKQGTGLGLAICRYVVEAHGGAIGVTSRTDKGSKFWFTLPKV